MSNLRVKFDTSTHLLNQLLNNRKINTRTNQALLLITHKALEDMRGCFLIHTLASNLQQRGCLRRKLILHTVD